MKAEKKQIRLHFARAAGTYDSQAGIQKRVADRLLSLVDEHITCPPDSVLEIGCCTGLLTQRIIARFPQLGVLHLNDLVENFGQQIGLGNYFGQVEFLGGDIEIIPLPQRYQLVISSSTFHWLHDLAAFFAKLRVHMDAGSLLAFAMYGPGNLQEIRSLTGIGLEYPSLQQLVDLVGRDFEVRHATESMETMFFSDPAAVLQHLRQTGVNALAGPAWSRRQLQEFILGYRERFSWKGGVRLSYHPMYLLAHPR